MVFNDGFVVINHKTKGGVLVLERIRYFRFFFFNVKVYMIKFLWNNDILLLNYKINNILFDILGLYL